MDPHLLVRSLLVGVAVAAPVGPIGVLVIRRSLTPGGLHGFVTGLGAATGDAIFALAAALGLGAIMTASQSASTAVSVLRIAGGTVLCVLAARTLLRKPHTDDRQPTTTTSAIVGRRALVRNFVTTLLLTLTSPVTILSFAAIASSLGVRATAAVDGATLVAGVFVGSTAWWAFLSGTIARFRGFIPTRAIRWLDRGSALILGGFGVAALFA